MNDLVKARIIELVPDIHQRWKDSFYVPVRNGAGKDSYSDSEEYVDENPEFTPVQLHDVLRALEYVPIGFVLQLHQHGDAFFFQENQPYWNLATDYDSQEQHVKDFIGTLLGVTSPA